MQKSFQPGILSLMMLACIPFAVLADTGFRGDGNGQFKDAAPPLRWAADRNIAWNTGLKPSNASPIIVGDRIFVCEEPDSLLALGLADGKVLWSVSSNYAAVLPPQEAKTAQYNLPVTQELNGYTSPTPVTDGVNVYVVYGSGMVTGFTLAGRRLWGRLLPVLPHHAWGHSASPRLADGLLLVPFGHKVFALDAKTGADKWVADADTGFGSPLVTRIKGVSVLVTPDGDIFAVADGRKLAGSIFRFPWNSPVVQDSVIYKIDEDGAAAVLLILDGAMPPPCLWKTMQIPKGRYYATAIVHENLVYNVSQYGVLVVLDANDGSVVYQKELELGGTVYPSPALAGGRLYISSDTGKTVVVKPGRVYEELARNTLPPFRSSPVFIGDSMLVRTNESLCRIQEKKSAPAAER